jgi:hypothetical protein
MGMYVGTGTAGEKLGGRQLEKINKGYLELWNKYRSDREATLRYPLAYPELNKRAVLFVGLNPSFSNDAWNRMLREKNVFKEKDANAYFSFHDNQDYSLEVAIEAEEIAREEYIPYFGQIESIGKYFDRTVEHIDMFASRETNSKECKDIVLGKNGDLSPFGKAQYDIFCDLLSLLEPIAIVVINASASRIFKQEMSPLKYDKQSGVYWPERNSGMQSKPPIFFSGMLSGQHSLDVNSRDRLFWHLAQELRKNKTLKNDYDPDQYGSFCKKKEEGEKRPMAD